VHACRTGLSDQHLQTLGQVGTALLQAIGLRGTSCSVAHGHTVGQHRKRRLWKFA